MALRTIRVIGDPILDKKSKEVSKMTLRLSELIDDMIDTMHDANGVGIAAPQVGILKKIVVIEVEEGKTYIFINPVITSTAGTQDGEEGCLSVPGKIGEVIRPQKVTVKALDRDMKPFELEAEDLLARAICHECDHLDGILYIQKIHNALRDIDRGDSR